MGSCRPVWVLSLPSQPVFFTIYADVKIARNSANAGSIENMSHSALLTILATILLISGCATQPRWDRYELCFGLTQDAGQTRISDQQWRQFRDEEILPRFPDGVTLYDAQGYWRNGTNTYSEPSMVLMVVAPVDIRTARKMADIAKAYKKQFHQESVLQIRSRVRVEFNE